jgi:hypothetical protein
MQPVEARAVAPASKSASGVSPGHRWQTAPHLSREVPVVLRDHLLTELEAVGDFKDDLDAAGLAKGKRWG